MFVILFVVLALAESRRSLAGRVGAYALHSQYDSRQITRNAREAFLRKWIDQVDPDRQLPEDERLRRAENALKSHMARLALKSAQSRRRKTAAK